MGTQKNARCIEVQVGGHSVALCLALNANHAKEEHEYDGGNGSEYGDWTEVTDGSKHTRRETADKVLDDARKFAWKTIGDIGQSLRNKRAAHGKNRSNGQQASVTSALVADKPSYVPHRAPILQLTNAPMKQQPAQTKIIHESASGEISSDSTGNRGSEGNADIVQTTVLNKADESESGQKQHGAAKKKPIRQIDDHSCKVYIGTRLGQELSEKSCFLPKLRYRSMETNVRMYRCKSKSDVTISAITEEIIYIMYRTLGQQEKSTNYAECRQEGATTTMDKITKETMMYTTKDWNAIIKKTDEEVGANIKEEETSDVKIVDVMVKVTKGKRIHKTTNRLICYTTEFLNSNRLELLKVQGKSKEEFKEDESSRLLLLCLLVYTGWGLYTGSNETTIVSCDDVDNGETTVSVTQGERSCIMFDTKTEFTFTDTGVSSVQAKDQSKESAAASTTALRDSDQSAKSASTGSAPINQNATQIVTRAAHQKAQVTSASKQSNGAEFTVTLRSSGKQHAKSSKANEAPKAAKAAKAGGAFKTREDKKASDTSSSSSSDEATAKDLRRSARIAEKNNGNKSK